MITTTVTGGKTNCTVFGVHWIGTETDVNGTKIAISFYPIQKGETGWDRDSLLISRLCKRRKRPPHCEK